MKKSIFLCGVILALSSFPALCKSQEWDYISVSMKEADSSACVASVSLELPTPNLVFCMHKCLAMGYECKAVTYTASEICQISYDTTTGPCADSGSRSFVATARVPFTTTTTTTTPTTPTPSNLALGASIHSSSPPYSAYYPENVINGLAESASTSDSFCNNDVNPYVILDLGSEYTVTQVILWSRPGGGYYSQVQNMEFRVATSAAGLTSASAVCYYRSGTPSTRPEIFNCNSPIVGRYVKASQLTTSGYFCFVELEVYGH